MRLLYFVLLIILSVCFANDQIMMLYQLEDLTLAKYNSGNTSSALQTLISKYSLSLIQGIKEESVIEKIKTNLGEKYEVVSSALRVEYQAIYYKKEIFHKEETVTDNFVSISPLIVKFMHEHSKYSFYVAGLRTNTASIDYTYFFNIYSKLSSPTAFLGDWKQCKNFTNSFTTNNTLSWKVTDSTNTLTNGSCASSRVVTSNSLEYLYPSVSVSTKYKADLTISTDLSNHFPLLLTLTFPPKPETSFWIELAIIGGGILFFLVFTSSLMVCFCLTLNLISSFKSHSSTTPIPKKEQEIKV